MKSITCLLIACSLSPNVAIAATVLTIPIERVPCTTVQLPSGGTACTPPKLSQRRNVAPRLIKIGDTIRTQYETNAKKLCHHWGGKYVIPVPNQDRAWDCFKLG